jgi:predicted ATPase
MNITKLSLTNFRSFQQTQTIEFAPVTLLFGPNSVGKSSVLMALFYLQHVINKGQCDPQRIEALGNKYVGGFKNLINGKDLSKTMVIKVEYQKPKNQAGHSFDDSTWFIDGLTQKAAQLGEALSEPLLNMSSPSEWADEVAIEFEIKWSFAEKTAFVCRQSVWLDNEFILEVENTKPNDNAEVSRVNYLHPLFKTDDEDDTDPGLREDGSSGEFHHHVLEAATSKPIDVLLPNSQQMFVHAPFHFQSRVGTLPRLDRKLETSLESEHDLITRRIEEIFSDVIVASLANLSDVLSESVAIGPLRQIPDSTFDAEDKVIQKDWYSGKASWDTIFNASMDVVHRVNRWMAGSEWLDLGYALVEKSEQGRIDYISDGDKFSDFTRRQLNEESTEDPNHKYFSSREYQQDVITLWDLSNDIEVSASDVGAGISQVFPLVVAAESDKRGLICCEQPELHLHPKAQVSLGDLLTQTDSKNHYLIETHSEHLILRLLRRIRETTEQTLPSGFTPVSKEDLSIIYLESTEAGVVAHKTQLTDDGDLETGWPSGFFDERDEELF